MGMDYKLCRHIVTRKVKAKYQVRFYHDYFQKNSDFTFIGEAATLEEAKAMRKVNGDLVTDERGNVIHDAEWL